MRAPDRDVSRDRSSAQPLARLLAHTVVPALWFIVVGCAGLQPHRPDTSDLTPPPLLVADAPEVVSPAEEWRPWRPLDERDRVDRDPAPEPRRDPPPPAEHGRGRDAARAAARWVGLKSLRSVTRRFGDDCSGLVRLAYERAGIRLPEVEPVRGENLVTTLWRATLRARAHRQRTPRPGDLVFFRETYDRDRDGERDDGLTHVGIVEKVERNGTVIFIHRSSTGVVRSRLHRLRRSERTDERGKVLNDYVRRSDGTNAPRLAGELFAGYAAAGALPIAPPTTKSGTTSAATSVDRARASARSSARAAGRR